jgi:hypothetical protein
MFCRSLIDLFSFFFWPLCCLFLFDLLILVTPLVSSNSTLTMLLDINGLWNTLPCWRDHLNKIVDL